MGAIELSRSKTPGGGWSARPQRPARETRPINLDGLLTLALALGCWPLLSAFSTGQGPIENRIAMVVTLNGATAYTFFAWNRRLLRQFRFGGADKYVLMLIGLLLIDLLFQVQVIYSGEPGFHVYSSSLGRYSIAFSYPHLRAILFGVLVIAYGFSLLRLDDGLGGLLVPYAYTQIAWGMALCSLRLAHYAQWPMIAGWMLLALILLRLPPLASTQPAAANDPPASGGPTGPAGAGEGTPLGRKAGRTVTIG